MSRNFQNEDDYPVIDSGSDRKWWQRDSSEEVSGQQESVQIIAPIDQNASWFKTYWRPFAAWQYILVCLFDFIIGPTITILFFHATGQDYIQWSPLTLQAGGFYHMAMGAVLGIYAWSRGQEKMKYVD